MFSSGLSEPGVPGFAMTPPDFERSVNPISTGVADYAHHITTCSPGFSDLPTALQLIVQQMILQGEEMGSKKLNAIKHCHTTPLDSV